MFDLCFLPLLSLFDLLMPQRNMLDPLLCAGSGQLKLSPWCYFFFFSWQIHLFFLEINWTDWLTSAGEVSFCLSQANVSGCSFSCPTQIFNERLQWCCFMFVLHFSACKLHLTLLFSHLFAVLNEGYCLCTVLRRGRDWISLSYFFLCSLLFTDWT